MARAYLDYNATAPLHPKAQEAMEEVWRAPLNPSSVHQSGRKAKALLEKARKDIAETVNAFPNELIFTGSGTEANALALCGTTATRVLVPATEHASVLNAREDREIIPVDAQGLVRLGRLEEMLASGKGKSTLVSVMLANNETGVIQPVSDIVTLAHRYGAWVHTDAAQAIGRIRVDMQALGVDLLSFCAHKTGGPVGVGALVVQQKLAIKPLIKGGRQELGRRAGTENIPAILGMQAIVGESFATGPWQLWRDRMEAAICVHAPGAVIYGEKAPRLPNTSCIAMPGVKNETQLMAFDLEGFEVSAGAACSSGKIAGSHVLEAMGVSPFEGQTAIRVSIGWGTKEQELMDFTNAWIRYFDKRQEGLAA